MEKKQLIPIGVIIAIIVGILLLVFYEKVRYVGIEESHKEICKREVQINAISKFVQPNINCPPLYITIKTEPNSKETKRQIAELMKDARDVYDVAWQEKDLFSETSGVFCAPYAVIDFKQKNKFIECFEKYLRTTPYSPLKSDSYMDYFSGGVAPPPSGEKDLLSTKSSYAVLFLYTKEYEKIKTVTNKLGELTAGEKWEMPVPEAGTTGQVVAIVGGGVLVGAVALAGGVVIGAGVFSIAAITAAGIFTGSGASAWAIFKDKEEPKISSYVLLVPYNNFDDLEKLGCEYFPVPLGTRPQ